MSTETQAPIQPKSLDEVTLPDPRSYASQVFPLKDHILYGDVASFESAPCLMPAVLAGYTSRCDIQPGVTSLEICPACFFSTSGTTSRSKQVPYSDADLDRQRIHEAIALRKLGMRAGDGVISLGAPLPSISGWAIVNGSAAVGAQALNSSQLDYEEALSPENRARASVVIGTPLVVREIGLAIEEEHGSLRDVFPNMRMAVIFGDVLPDEMRADIARIWGNPAVYSLYGTVEADVVATECPQTPGTMYLMAERLVFEIITEAELARERNEEGYVPQVVDINTVPAGTIGEIIISDLSREVLPLIRYRIGDVVKVLGHDVAQPQLGQRISVLGRAKNTVLIDEVPLYEMQLTASLDAAIRGRFSDWRLVRQPAQGDGPRHFTLFVEMRPGETLNGEDCSRIWAEVAGQRAELAVIDIPVLIEIAGTPKLEQDKVQGDAKARRIVLDV
ncbi:phenylacetate--CoA ligase family protein [Zoogloea sp.]|uniref:phenylacetate--CoA ligase family protein n=1 Tax=Zoogloea sp. TaxID=49181 RepID=UPI0035B25CE9